MEERWSEGHSCEIFLLFWDIFWAWLYHPLFLVEVAEHNRVQYSRNEDERDFLVVAVFKGKSRAFHIWTEFKALDPQPQPQPVLPVTNLRS